MPDPADASARSLTGEGEQQQQQQQSNGKQPRATETGDASLPPSALAKASVAQHQTYSSAQGLDQGLLDDFEGEGDEGALLRA